MRAMISRNLGLRTVVGTVVWVTLCLASGLAGCSSEDAAPDATARGVSSASSPVKGPRRGGRLVIGVQQEPERLSEILNSTATTQLICNLIFSKFVKYDDEMTLIPDVITEIPTRANGGITADFLTYTYHLRSDMKWHDGTPVTSGDVKFTYQLIMDPRVNVESREGWDVIETVETPDAHTVVFRLKRPYPDFVAELNDGRLFVVEYKGAHLADSADTDEKRLIGKLWEDRSEGKGLFMVVEKEVDGADMREQIRRNVEG